MICHSSWTRLSHSRTTSIYTPGHRRACRASDVAQDGTVLACAASNVMLCLYCLRVSEWQGVRHNAAEGTAASCLCIAVFLVREKRWIPPRVIRRLAAQESGRERRAHSSCAWAVVKVVPRAIWMESGFRPAVVHNSPRANPCPWF